MTKKTIASVVLGLALVVTPAVAGAQTTAQLQAQIAALMAQLAALQGGSATATVQFTQDLTVGSTGSQVVALQQMLVAKGYLVMPAGVAFGYFGPATKAAVIKWQLANGVPGTGYFGPMSRAKANAAGGTTTGGTVVGGGASAGGALQGGAGEISDADFMAELNSEEVGEGDEDVEIAGLDIEADGSDIELRSVTIDFDELASANDDIDEYASEVSIWFEGRKVAEVDASVFADDDNVTDTITLSSGAIIREGDTAELVVAVSALDNLDSSTQIGDDFNVAFEAVRYVDAQGAVVTDSTTGDITDGNDDTTTDAGERAFSFVSFATAADIELKISSGDEDVNDAHIITVDDDSQTEGVEVLSFEAEVEGDSDLTVEDLVVEFTVTGAANLDDMVSDITLLMDGDEVAAETVPTDDGTVTFDNIDLDLEAGETYEFTVEVDFLSLDGNLDAGDTISATVGETETDAWVVEDETGEDLADDEKTGSATAGAHATYESGIAVELVSTDEEVTPGADGTADDDTVTHTLVFDVTAVGDTVYLSNLATATTTADGGVTAIDVDNGGILYRYEIDGTATTSQLSDIVTKTDINGTVADDGVDEYTLEEGEKARVTVTITRTNVTTEADSDGFHEVQLVALGWSTTQDDDTMEVYEFDLEDFKTGPIFAN